MKRGDLAWVEAHKRRPAILVHVADGWVTVVCGTSTDRSSWARLCVFQNSRAGQILKLSNTTYFYPRNVVVVKPEDVAVSGPCPSAVFLDLETLMIAEAKNSSDKR